MTYTHEALAKMLWAQAKGLYTDEAAVELVVRHDVWLRRADFHRFIQVETDPETVGTPMAMVQWQDAADALNTGDLAGSTSETAVLRIAAALGGGGPVDLRACLGSLDTTNTHLVTCAIRHANSGGRGEA
ncbi:hypothetical protein [Streptosporangium roseum]|uniref:hypothetical protein n=1 Tax=Streptosporangium roseum TaxID=2001 RepID=UPI0004CCF43B|nr:hypothetical protein [Streptosporangium roseum]